MNAECNYLFRADHRKIKTQQKTFFSVGTIMVFWFRG